MAISDRIELDIDVPFYLPNIGIYKVALHLTQAFFSLLVASLIGSIISFQKHHIIESSQSSSTFTLVIATCSLFIALTLALAPISKFRMIKPFRDLFLRPRTDLVLNIFFSLAWIIVSIVVTTQALEQNTCTHELINNSITQCNCIKASAVFSWIGVFIWITTVIHSLILFCNQKQVNRNSVYEKEDISSSSSSSYDADAPTIVEMQYSEKHKQPIVSYNDFHGPVYDPPQQVLSSNTTLSMYIPDSPYSQTTEQVYHYESDQYHYNPYTASSVPFPHKY